jgi:hypothetical protein
MKTKIFNLIVAALLVVTFGCSDDDNNSTTEGPSYLSVKLVDAPGDYEHVYVDVQDVMIKVNNDSNDDSGWISIDAINTGVYDLLELTGGINVLLADGYEIPSGTLNQIRLILGTNNSVVIDGQTYPLNTPSAQQSGLKIKVNQPLQPFITYTFLLDFDVDSSIVLAPDTSNINLKPVIRASVEAETGAISGTITDYDTLQSQVLIEATNGIETFSAYTNDLGEYVLVGLPNGTYTVTASADATLGFASVIVTNVNVEVGQTTTLNPITFQ